MSDRVSDVITKIRQLAGEFDDLKNDFEQYATEFAVHAENGRVQAAEDGTLAAHGHADVTLAEIQAAMKQRKIILEEGQPPDFAGQWTVGDVLAMADALARWAQSLTVTPPPQTPAQNNDANKAD